MLFTKRTTKLFFLLLILILNNAMAEHIEEFDFKGLEFANLGQEGNGGGGIKRDGKYMTFYSAGLYTERLEEELENIPNLLETIDAISSVPGLSSRIKVKYLKALSPTPRRKYYKVKESYFSTEVRNKVIREYARITGASKDELTIFAMTDVDQQITYLLPNFYRLTEVEQMSILFHESYWIVNKDRTNYSEVTTVEARFQKYLENPNNINSRHRLVRELSNSKDWITYAISSDVELNLLETLYESGNRIKLSKLMGQEVVNCFLESNYFESACKELWNFRVYQLKKEFPNSLFIPLLSKLQLSDIFENGQGLANKEKFIEKAYLIFEDVEYRGRCLQVDYTQKRSEYESGFAFSGYVSKFRDYSKNIFCILL